MGKIFIVFALVSSIVGSINVEAKPVEGKKNRKISSTLFHGVKAISCFINQGSNVIAGGTAKLPNKNIEKFQIEMTQDQSPPKDFWYSLEVERSGHDGKDIFQQQKWISILSIKLVAKSIVNYAAKSTPVATAVLRTAYDSLEPMSIASQFYSMVSLTFPLNDEPAKLQCNYDL